MGDGYLPFDQRFYIPSHNIDIGICRIKDPKKWDKKMVMDYANFERVKGKKEANEKADDYIGRDTHVEFKSFKKGTYLMFVEFP